jgi:hypothetical protein
MAGSAGEHPFLPCQVIGPKIHIIATKSMIVLCLTNRESV